MSSQCHPRMGMWYDYNELGEGGLTYIGMGSLLSLPYTQYRFAYSIIYKRFNKFGNLLIL